MLDANVSGSLTTNVSPSSDLRMKMRDGANEDDVRQLIRNDY